MHNGESRLSLALECLERTGILSLRVTGVSMLPHIPPRSYVRIRRVPAERLAEGDIVLARTASGVRLHRLIAIEGSAIAGSHYITRGDANDAADPPVPAASILGVLDSVETPTWRDRLKHFWSAA
jgi:hypothetical protein